MRNEVSAAIVSGREHEQATRALGELADIYYFKQHGTGRS